MFHATSWKLGAILILCFQSVPSESLNPCVKITVDRDWPKWECPDLAGRTSAQNADFFKGKGWEYKFNVAGGAVVNFAVSIISYTLDAAFYFYTNLWHYFELFVTWLWDTLGKLADWCKTSFENLCKWCWNAVDDVWRWWYYIVWKDTISWMAHKADDSFGEFVLYGFLLIPCFPLYVVWAAAGLLVCGAISLGLAAVVVIAAVVFLVLVLLAGILAIAIIILAFLLFVLGALLTTIVGVVCVLLAAVVIALVAVIVVAVIIAAQILIFLVLWLIVFSLLMSMVTVILMIRTSCGKKPGVDADIKTQGTRGSAVLEGGAAGRAEVKLDVESEKSSNASSVSAKDDKPKHDVLAAVKGTTKTKLAVWITSEAVIWFLRFLMDAFMYIVDIIMLAKLYQYFNWVTGTEEQTWGTRREMYDSFGFNQDISNSLDSAFSWCGLGGIMHGLGDFVGRMYEISFNTAKYFQEELDLQCYGSVTIATTAQLISGAAMLYMMKASQTKQQFVHIMGPALDADEKPEEEGANNRPSSTGAATAGSDKSCGKILSSIGMEIIREVVRQVAVVYVRAIEIMLSAGSSAFVLIFWPMKQGACDFEGDVLFFYTSHIVLVVSTGFVVLCAPHFLFMGVEPTTIQARHVVKSVLLLLRRPCNCERWKRCRNAFARLLKEYWTFLQTIFGVWPPSAFLLAGEKKWAEADIARTELLCQFTAHIAGAALFLFPFGGIPGKIMQHANRGYVFRWKAQFGKVDQDKVNKHKEQKLIMEFQHIVHELLEHARDSDVNSEKIAIARELGDEYKSHFARCRSRHAKIQESIKELEHHSMPAFLRHAVDMESLRQDVAYDTPTRDYAGVTEKALAVARCFIIFAIPWFTLQKYRTFMIWLGIVVILFEMVANKLKTRQSFAQQSENDRRHMEELLKKTLIRYVCSYCDKWEPPKQLALANLREWKDVATWCGTENIVKLRGSEWQNQFQIQRKFYCDTIAKEEKDLYQVKLLDVRAKPDNFYPVGHVYPSKNLKRASVVQVKVLDADFFKAGMIVGFGENFDDIGSNVAEIRSVWLKDSLSKTRNSDNQSETSSNRSSGSGGSGYLQKLRGVIWRGGGGGEVVQRPSQGSKVSGMTGKPKQEESRDIIIALLLNRDDVVSENKKLFAFPEYGEDIFSHAIGDWTSKKEENERKMTIEKKGENYSFKEGEITANLSRKSDCLLGEVPKGTIRLNLQGLTTLSSEFCETGLLDWKDSTVWQKVQTQEEKANALKWLDVDAGNRPKLANIKVLAVDLDNTFYPNGMGDATTEPTSEAKEELVKNIQAFKQFTENEGIAILVTRNSPALAQKKFDPNETWNIEKNPGVFFNGALILGVNGEDEYSAPVPESVMNKLRAWAAESNGLFEFEGMAYPFAVTFMTKSKVLHFPSKNEESLLIARGWARMQLMESETAAAEIDWKVSPAYQVNLLLKSKDELLKQSPASETDAATKNPASETDVATKITKIQNALLADLEKKGELKVDGCQAKHVLEPWCETNIVMSGVDKVRSLNRFIHCKSAKKKLVVVNVASDVMVAGDAAMFAGWSEVSENDQTLVKTERPAIRIIMPDSEDEELKKEANLQNKIYEVIAAIPKTKAIVRKQEGKSKERQNAKETSANPTGVLVSIIEEEEQERDDSRPHSNDPSPPAPKLA